MVDNEMEAEMNDRWVPSSPNVEYSWGMEQLLYALLGPDLSDELVSIAKGSDKASETLRTLIDRLDEIVGEPPQQLFFIGLALGRLQAWLQNPVAPEEDEELAELLRRVGWDALKMSGSIYMGMFQRFGFDEDTIGHYMRTSIKPGLVFSWPPPGVAYEQCVDRMREGDVGFVPTYIRADPSDPNSPILEATVMDEDGEVIRLYMSPPRDQ